MNNTFVSGNTTPNQSTKERRSHTHHRTKIYRIAFIACVTASLALSSYAQQLQLAQDCDGQVSPKPPDAVLSCTGWFIRLYTASGKKWGRISGKTRADVEAELARSRTLDHKAAVGTSVLASPNHASYDYPSAPICEMCDPRAVRTKPQWSAFCANPSVADAANARKSYLCSGALSEVADWITRVGRTSPVLLDRLNQPNPFSNLLSTVGPYLTSLVDVMHRVNDLREKLKTATDWTEIDGALRKLRQQAELSHEEYTRIPGTVRAWLEGENVSVVEGVWSNQSANSAFLIIKNGNSFYIEDEAQRSMQGTINGNVISVPAARRPFGIANYKECGLSSNVLYANIGYRFVFSDDGKYFTLEEVVDKFVAGQCEYGGVIQMGRWNKIR